MAEEKHVYGPPGCISKDTLLKFYKEEKDARYDYSMKIDDLYKIFDSSDCYKIQSIDHNGEIIWNKIADVVYSGKKAVYEISCTIVLRLYGDEYVKKKIKTTSDHPFRLFHVDDYVELKNLSVNDTIGCTGLINEKTSLCCGFIDNIQYVGEEDTYDIVMEDPYRNFVAHDFILHNCGKTTYICNEIIQDMEKKYGEDKIMITSFTRTAAINIAERAGLEKNEKHGTLHSISYAALKKPALVNTVINEWNDKYPNYSMKSSGESLIGTDQQTNILLSEYNYNRNMMLPKDNWSKLLRDFADKFESFKDMTHTVDFTDMIVKGKEKLVSPPFGTSVIIVDEAQDFTPLQISLVRSWGITIPMVWFVYDDDQAIFAFQGVDISCLIKPDKPIKQENKIFLQQSYRVPSKPHKFAMKVSSRISEREEKIYKPTTVEGDIQYGIGGIDTPEWAIDKAMSLDGTSMFIASCAYMLNTLIFKLKELGIPFYNPYKLEEKRWNPLNTKITKIMYAFLSEGDDSPYWSTEQLLTWITEIQVYNQKKEIFGKKRGVKKMLEILEKELWKGTEGLHTCREYISDLLCDEALELALNRDFEWFSKTIMGKYKSTFDFPKDIYLRNGKDKEVLCKKPKILVGTIHSVKGAEAENVFVYPDMSYAAMQEWDKAISGKDNMHRLMYVAVTRTKNNLYIMEPQRNSRKLYYDFPKID